VIDMAGPYAIGVDVGGTKILAGVVDCSDGQVIGLGKLNSPLGAAAVMETVRQAIGEALTATPELDRAQLRGIGVAAAGQVDRERGVLLSAPNLGGGIDNVDFAGPLSAHFHLPVWVENDVVGAALGEARFGAGRDQRLCACVFVGTGVGGALLVNGERYTGAAGSAGEIGHMMIRAGGRLCGCGQRGHLEAYASRTAIVAMLNEGMNVGRKTILEEELKTPGHRIKSGMLLRAVKEGDKLTIRSLKRSAYFLGLGLASLINLWSPDRIVLGGGVIEKIDLLVDIAAQTAKAAALPVPAQAVEIVRTALGDYSGVVGAAMLAHEGRAAGGES
jgi:glucokinase